MKIIFTGTPQFACPSLEALNQHHQILAVITEPNRPQGRGQKISPTPVKELALKLGLPILEKPINQLIFDIQNLQPDVLVVVAYGEIIPPEILAIPRFGAINIHPSLLPQYRGSSPITAAILNGDSETGVSLIKMTSSIDAGPIIAQTKMQISPTETAGTLEKRLALESAELLVKTLQEKILARPACPQTGAVTYAKKIKPDDAELKLTKPAVTLERQVRAYNPKPGAFLKMIQIDRLKIWQARMTTPLTSSELLTTPLSPIKVYAGEPIIETTNGNWLILEAVQPPGKKVMSGQEFVRGYLKTTL